VLKFSVHANGLMKSRTLAVLIQLDMESCGLWLNSLDSCSILAIFGVLSSFSR